MDFSSYLTSQASSTLCILTKQINDSIYFFKIGVFFYKYIIEQTSFKMLVEYHSSDKSFNSIEQF